MWMHGWGADWGGWGWAWWPLMMLVPILFWGGVIALVVWGVSRAVRGGGGEASKQKSPMELADERYARGEITREQWEQLRKDLGR